MFVHELTGCEFESSSSHLNFRFRACFEQGVPSDSGNYRVWIHSETRTSHDNNIQSLTEDHFLIYIDFIKLEDVQNGWKKLKLSKMPEDFHLCPKNERATNQNPVAYVFSHMPPPDLCLTRGVSIGILYLESVSGLMHLAIDMAQN